METKSIIKELKGDSLKMKKPCMWLNSTLITGSIMMYVGLCMFMLGTFRCCCHCPGNWIRFVLVALLIVTFSVLEFYLVKALLSAREEALKPYHKAEQKLACVYEKIMDEYFDAAKKEVQKSSSQSNDTPPASGTPNIEPTLEDRKKDAYIQILDAYVAHLRKSDNLRFENVEEIKKMVDGLTDGKEPDKQGQDA